MNILFYVIISLQNFWHHWWSQNTSNKEDQHDVQCHTQRNWAYARVWTCVQEKIVQGKAQDHYHGENVGEDA